MADQEGQEKAAAFLYFAAAFSRDIMYAYATAAARFDDTTPSPHRIMI